MKNINLSHPTARLSAAIARIDQFGFSTTQSETSDDPTRASKYVTTWSSIVPVDNNNSLLNNIRLSDLTSDDEDY